VSGGPNTPGGAVGAGGGGGGGVSVRANVCKRLNLDTRARE
jgi:hypothetical protein